MIQEKQGTLNASKDEKQKIALSTQITKRQRQLDEVKKAVSDARVEIDKEVNTWNLRRYWKGEGESEMMKGLVEVNAGKEGVLEEMRKGVSGEVKVEGRQDGEKRSGKVELLGEVHDKHGGSVKKLVERMERWEMGKGTVIALERKEGGEHLGMRDVRLLAEVMRHNEGCKAEEKVALPVGIEGSALWWDAKLVNVAKDKGVQVVGVEGKGLAHDQHSPEYNKDREDYITQQLAQLKQQGYDVWSCRWVKRMCRG